MTFEANTSSTQTGSFKTCKHCHFTRQSHGTRELGGKLTFEACPEKTPGQAAARKRVNAWLDKYAAMTEAEKDAMAAREERDMGRRVRAGTRREERAAK